MKVIWSSDEDEILIKFVRAHDILYNVKHKNYRQTKAKQKLWCEIGSTLNKTVAECYKRWCYVRDYYIRRKGRIITTGEAAKKRADLLSFIDHFSLSQKNLLEIDNQAENSQDDDEPITYFKHDTDDISYEDDDSNTYNESDSKDLIDEDSNIQFGLKRKRDSNSQECLNLSKPPKSLPALNELDETDLFFHAMAKIVKKLPRHEQVRIRMQIGSLVGDAELRCIPIEVSSISSYVKTEYSECD